MGKCRLKSVSVCLSVPLPHPARAPLYQQRATGSCHGFTLIEILISILIVLTLTGIAVPLAADHIHKTNVDRAVLDIRKLEKEILLFEMEKGRFPGWNPDMLESMQEIGRDNFLDPWGTPYQYRNLSLSGNDLEGKPKHCRKDRSRNPLNYDFDLYSVGPDREVPTHKQITVNQGADDIIRAANGRYVGEGAKF